MVDASLFVLNDAASFFKLHLDMSDNNIYTTYITFNSLGYEIDNSDYFFTNIIDDQNFRYDYLTFKVQHLNNINTHIVIPQYLDSNNELKYYMNTNIWDAFNLNNQLEQILLTGSRFETWYESEEIQTAKNIYRYELHDLVWDNRDVYAFNKYGIRHYELDYLLENSYRNQITYLRNSVYEDTLLISPCVINYFRFRP